MPPQQSKQPDFIPATAPDFIPAGPDFVPAQQQAQPEAPGFFASLLPDAVMHPGQAAQEEAQHPIRSVVEDLPGVAPLESMFSGAKRSGGELLDAASALRGGNPASAAVHAVSSVPVLGPALVKGAQQAPALTGSYGRDVLNAATDPGTMGTLTGAAATAAPALLGGLDAITPGRGLVGQIPRTSRAIAKFESLKNDLANVPVPLNRSAPALQNLAEIDATGAPMPVTASKLLNRSQAIFPPNYPEARLFQENLSNPSVLEKQGIGGSMKGGIKQLKGSLYEDIYNAADGAGRGEDYASAMKEFRQAAQIKDGLKKAAIPLAVGGAATVAGPSIAHYLKTLF